MDAAEVPDLDFPVASTEWVIVNTRGSHTNPHTDSQGAVTWIKVENDDGEKAWAVPAWKKHMELYRGDGTAIDPSCMFSATLFSDLPHMPPFGPIDEWEVVVLHKGDLL